MTDCWSDWDDEQVGGSVPDEGYAPFNFPVEGAYLPFFFTDQTFMEVLSALWNGALITYPDRAYEIIWNFLINVEYPMSFCEQLIACITTDDDVKAAFRNFVINDPEINQHIQDIAAEAVLSLENRLGNLLKPEQCDPDYIFNQCSVLVQLLHDVTEDIFEAVEVGSNALERGDIVVDAIPVVGALLPFDEILALGDQLVEEVAEDYSGAYDEALYDDIRCGLFCLVKDDCTLNIDQTINFYIEKLGEEVPDDPFEAAKIIMGYIIAGDFETDAPVYLMHLFVLVMIRLTQNVFGIDFGKLGMRVTAAGDDPNNDWETLCEDCPPEPPAGPWELWTSRIAQPVGVLTQSQEPDGLSGTVIVIASLGGDGIYRAAVFSPGTGISGCKTITSASGYSPNTYSEQGCTGIAGSFVGSGYMDRIYITNSSAFTFEFTWSA